MRTASPRILLALLLAAVGTPISASKGQPVDSRRLKVDVEAASINAFEASAAGAGAALVTDVKAFRVYAIDASMQANLSMMSGVTLRPDYDRILLRRRTIETGFAASPTPLAAERPPCLVQFAGPVTDAGLAALAATGARIVHAVPQNACIVWADRELTRAALTEMVVAGKILQHVEPFGPSDAISPALDAAVGRIAVTVQIFNVSDAKSPFDCESVRLIRSLTLREISPPEAALGGRYLNVTAEIAAGEIPRLAARGDVVNIEPWLSPTQHSERQAMAIAGVLNGTETAPASAGYLPWLQERGFTSDPAAYPVLTIADDGVDDASAAPLDRTLHVGGSPTGASRVVSFVNATEFDGPMGVRGHGHINASIAGGFDPGVGPLDGSFVRGLGINPFARLASTKIFTDGGTYDIVGTGGGDVSLIRAEHEQGSDLTSNSWGSAVRGAYTATSQAYDAGTRDASSLESGNQEMLFIFSAGNAGSSSTTIGAPASAKNVLTVGATEDTDADGVDGCTQAPGSADNIQQMANFSSRGPCADLRAKPDVVAPGTHVAGRASPVGGYTGQSVCDKYWPAGQTAYARSSGTSHSAPAVAGMATLMWNWLQRTHGISRPSPALLKASIVNASRYLSATGGSLPSPSQGFGFANAGLAFDASISRVIVDETAVLGSTGEARSYSGTVADLSKPVRITLAWTDAPGTPVASAWVNDLNLTVNIGGVTYKGNIFSGANSATNGSADARNNCECVFLPAGVSGQISVTVTAANIAGDGVPDNADATDQDFALVISNVAPSTVSLAVAGATTVIDALSQGNCNGNGRVDPGESEIRLFVPLRNASADAVTGLRTTLVSNTPTVMVMAGGSAYPTLAALGGTALNDAPFTLNVSPSHPCGAPISLTLRHESSLGSGFIAFTMPTGLPATPITRTFTYAGGPVPIPDADASGATASISVTGLTNPISKLVVRLGGSTCSTEPGATTVGLDHTSASDLTATLRSPTGSAMTLLSGAGGGGRNFCRTSFDDASPRPIQSILASENPWSGVYSPLSPLGVMLGRSGNGAWSLNVVDSKPLDTGTLRAWSLDITTTGASFCSAPQSICVTPSILSGPSSTTICGGASAQLAVIASGTNLSFQWRRDGATLPGANGRTLSVTSNDAGVFDCVVSNACGSATTSAATVTPSLPPIIVRQPVSQTTCGGGPATFSIDVSSPTPVSLQWRRNRLPLPAATGPALRLDAAGLEAFASYDCVVTNACGTAISESVSLTDTAPSCPADFNQDGGIDGNDLIDFFASWEAGDGCADANRDGGTDGADLEAFYAAWQSGGC